MFTNAFSNRGVTQFTCLMKPLTAIFAILCLHSWAEAAPKPNIVYILADDLGYADLSSFGQEKFDTPNIDRLASRGMAFTNHYSGSAVCAPSRSSLIAGPSWG